MSTHNVGLLPDKRHLVRESLASLGLIAAVTLLAVALLSSRAPTAHASFAGCVPTTGPNCTFKGNHARAEFDSVSSSGCVMTQAVIEPFDSLTRPVQSESQSMFVGISKFDACNNVLVEAASNFDPATGAPEFTGTIQFGPGSLSTAAVSGTAPMFDVFTGIQVFTSTIDVTWQGFGPTTTALDSMHSHTPGFIVYTHSMSTTRAAEASGTVTDETGANLATAPTLNAELDNAKSGMVVIAKS